jgi:hypothetical protein
VVHVESPLASLRELLEQRIQPGLAQGRFGIGPAGGVSYRAERGDLSLSVRGNQLVVETPVHARAEACRGTSCYASCEPEGVATALVPLLLRPDYGFDRAKVSLRFTRGCKVKALGGFLTVDVTPTLSSQLEPELAGVARRIDEQLHGLRESAAQLWDQLARPRELPFGGCLVLQPQRLIQGPLDDSSTSLRARFAVLARPELRTTCGELSPPPPLPALDHDAGMPDQDRIMLGLVTPLDGLQAAFLRSEEISIEHRRMQVKESRVEPLGSDVIVELSLVGDLCGDVAFAATPSFAKDGASVGLSRPRWLPGERERVAALGIELEPLLRSLAAAPRLTPLLSATALESNAPALAQMLSTPNLDVSAKISRAQGARAMARDHQLLSWIAMLGRLDMTLRSMTKPGL